LQIAVFINKKNYTTILCSTRTETSCFVLLRLHYYNNHSLTCSIRPLGGIHGSISRFLQTCPLFWTKKQTLQNWKRY